MSLRTTDPLSLGEVKRLAHGADTVLLAATRAADLETPIGAFLRLDDGGPGYLLESVEGGERLGRYSFFGVSPRRLLTIRDGLASVQQRPLGVRAWAPDLPTSTQAVTDLLATIRTFVLVTVASAVLAGVSYGVWWALDQALGRAVWAQIVSLGAALAAGGVAYLISCRLLGVRELEALLSLRARFRRT